MEEKAGEQVPPAQEVVVLDESLVKKVRWLSEQHWGSKRIAKELNISRNTVRRYLRDPLLPQPQERPTRRRLKKEQVQLVQTLFEGQANGNATLVAQLLADQGISISPRSVMRLVASIRQKKYALDKATVRFETGPGQQMQIDFGQTPVRIAGHIVKVHFLCAVLGFSRKIFVKAFLTERSDDWLEGIAEAFRYFGGVPRELLGDNTRCLVLKHDPSTETLIFKPSYLQFCRDWNVIPRATRPYRARTKGKTESAVKFIKGNAIAALEFASFAELEAHLLRWMQQSDERIHGTTHQRPSERFEQERAVLQPLPNVDLRVRTQYWLRKVSNDSMIHLDAVRYSVPAAYVGCWVAASIHAGRVCIFHQQQCIAEHPHCKESRQSVIQPEHFKELYRPQHSSQQSVTSSTEVKRDAAMMGRTLKDYQQAVEGRSQ